MSAGKELFSDGHWKITTCPDDPDRFHAYVEHNTGATASPSAGILTR